jgi:hypothetical protein
MIPRHCIDPRRRATIGDIALAAFFIAIFAAVISHV